MMTFEVIFLQVGTRRVASLGIHLGVLGWLHYGHVTFPRLPGDEHV